MPTVSHDGLDLHYVERGTGDETVVFSHSYLADHRHFEPQLAALSERYRVVAYDHRDHGQSGHATGRYTLDTLVDDAAAVIRQTGSGPCHWVGLSTGGFVGMRLAIRHPELLRSLVLMDTSAEPEPVKARIRYEGMFAVLRLAGITPLLSATRALMFGRSTLADPAHAEMVQTWTERIAAGDPRAIIRFGRAIFERTSVVEPLRSVSVPTLVLVGAEDRATPPRRARTIAQSIPGARLQIIERAGHLSTLEQPRAVEAALSAFLAGVGSA